eukprot:evm.model.scf_3036.1 EVM.evm.TU.scf_3036.1   scf_3036:800-5962(+)
MLDYFCIFARGGALLWTYQLTALKGSPVDTLVRSCLLEERVGDRSYNYQPPQGAAYCLKWTLHNGLGLVFVAVYQKALSLLYVDVLLERIKQEFAAAFKPDVYRYASFDDTFKRVLKECELRADQFKKPVGEGQAASGQGSVPRNGGSLTTPDGTSEEKDDDDDDDDTDSQHEGEEAAQGAQVDNADSQQDLAFDIGKLKKGKASAGGSRRGRGRNRKEVEKKKKTESSAPKKVDRMWETRGDVKELDFSEQQSPSANGHGDAVALSMKSKMEDPESDDEETIDVVHNEAVEGPKSSGVLSSFVKSISVNVMGTDALTKEDIQPALDGMKKKLMERNVASEIAAKLCDSVAGTLVGQKMGSFTRVSTTVHQAFHESLVRMLTPNRTINVLAEIEKSKARKVPYVMVFVGVNGVGKSTNLAKVAFWLLQNNLKVMIAACDTFRAGAVEQLRTHAQRLQVPLYERGYEKDAAKVAFEATKQATRDGCDVLLVDTAGRMQDNDPLMRALANLIHLNQPDLVLFVGEALVGNDAVDQLTKFNQRLADLATAAKPHLIDGILLTKFDTIDDKVGAALSMVYTSGAPIMFIGCGQTYQDLRRLNAKSVVKSLLA